MNNGRMQLVAVFGATLTTLVALGTYVWQTSRPYAQQASNYGVKPAVSRKSRPVSDVALELKNVVEFDIPDGEVRKQFLQFSKHLPFPSVYVSDARSKFLGNAVKGKYTIREAADIWLKYSGCEMTIDDDNHGLTINCFTGVSAQG